MSDSAAVASGSAARSELTEPAAREHRAAASWRSQRRADIQGLRALAVLAVFADHLFAWPPGGFVGVDIFFVISGFLITGLLLREFENTGHISFRGFYARRARRILPAALLTLGITTALGFWLFPRSKADAVAVDALAAALFGANWRFAATGTDYFAQGAPSPVQHFWSLAVEEQFYFLWPWVMLGILAVCTRLLRRGARAAVSVAGVFLGLAVIVSFIWALSESTASPTVAYFSTFSRAWELGVGAVLAVLGGVFVRLPAVARVLMAWGGLATIFVSLVIIHAGMAFPAPWALLPVAGTALTIAAGIGREPRGNVLLTNPVATYIGDVSYSLYLWHWPVIVLGLAMFPDGAVAYYVGASAVGLVLAILSFELVERPATSSPVLRRFASRQSRSLAWARWRSDVGGRVRLVSQAVLLPTLAGLVALGVAFPPGLSAAQIEQINAQNAQISQVARGGPTVPPYAATGPANQAIHDALSAVSWPDGLTPSIDSVQTAGAPDEESLGCERLDATSCEFGSGPEILVYGDSLVAPTLTMVRAAFESDHRIRGLGQPSCAVTDLDVVWNSDAERDACLTARKNVRTLVARDKPDTVLVIQNYAWAARLTSRAAGDALAAEWSRADAALSSDLMAAGAQRVVFMSSPPEGKSVVDCATAGAGPAACVSAVPAAWTVIDRVSAASGRPFVEQGDWFCAEGSCPAFSRTLIVRRDYVHPTKQYAQYLAAEFRSRLTAALSG